MSELNPIGKQMQEAWKKSLLYSEENERIDAIAEELEFFKQIQNYELNNSSEQSLTNLPFYKQRKLGLESELISIISRRTKQSGSSIGETLKSIVGRLEKNTYPRFELHADGSLMIYNHNGFKSLTLKPEEKHNE